MYAGRNPSGIIKRPVAWKACNEEVRYGATASAARRSSSTMMDNKVRAAKCRHASKHGGNMGTRLGGVSVQALRAADFARARMKTCVWSLHSTGYRLM
jgi:hypothetical protein